MTEVREAVAPATLRIPHEVAAFANCSLRTIRAAARDGSLRTIRLGKWRVARVETVNQWLASLETRGIPKATAQAHARRGDLVKARAAKGKAK